MRIEQKWGFGMAPVKPETQPRRIQAVNSTLAVIDTGQVSQETLDALSEVKGLFNRVVRQDQWDWFTVWVQLGRPGTRLAAKIADGLRDLRKALVSEDEPSSTQARTYLASLGIAALLKNYPHDSSIPREGFGCIYVLGAREQPDVLKIGYTNRSVEQRVKEVNAATGVLIPYGVRAMWVVEDAPGVESELHALLAQYRVRKDREFFNLRFKDAFTLISQHIRTTRQEH